VLFPNKPYINADKNTNFNKLEYKILFNEPDFKDIILENKSFTQVLMSNCISHGDPGAPSLPNYPIKILIPYGKKISNINAYSTDLNKLNIDISKKPIVPEQQPISIGINQTDNIFLLNDTIYNSTEPIYDKLYSNPEINYCRGYTILSVILKPVRYVPLEGEIFYYQEITLDIELKDNNVINPLFRNRNDDELWVKKLVYNPEVTKSYNSLNLPTKLEYSGGLCNPEDDYDYVILTTTANNLDHWATSPSTPYNWTSLMNKHESEDNLNCTLVTIQNISSCSAYWNSTALFNDTAAQIREFLRDAYQDWGLSYVLIGGDDDLIPAREMKYYYEDDVDSDLYWSNLDNTFNADQDSYWGEYTDGGFDLYSELYIGRLTCDVPQDVSNWMNKSFTYADSLNQDLIENAAFYGGALGWSCEGDDFIEYSALQGTNDWLGPDPDSHGVYPDWLGFQYGFETWNQENPDYLFNLSVKWTAETPNSGWSGGSEVAATSGLKNAINSNNVSLISGIAHASATMSLDVSASTWESDYTNTFPFFIHDYGCHCGDMDASDDGVLHSMLFHSDTQLAFGCVYNTGYGFGSWADTNSSSALQQKLFWDYFFDIENNSGGQENWQLGKAMAYSKDAMAPTVNWTVSGAYESWRGIIQGCTLFADPAQRLKVLSSDDIINLTEESPINQSTDIDVGNIILQITVNEPEENQMNVTFRTNATGSWSDIGTNESINDGTYSQSYNFNNINTQYFWSVNATDIEGQSGWANETYSFTTRGPHDVTAPTSFSASNYNKTIINLSWDKGTYATHTYIERNTSSNWPINQGISVYNGTSSTYNDTNLTEETTYYYQAWSWDNVDKIWNSTNSSVSATTSNSLPVLSNENPLNSSLNQNLTLNLTITVSDIDKDTMNISLYTNSTGPWNLIGFNDSSVDGTYSQINVTFDNYSTIYWWSVNCTDGTDWTNETYHLKTCDNQAVNIFSETPTNESTGVSISTQTLSVIISDYENDTFNWSIITIPNIGSNNDSIDTSGTKSCNITDLSYSTTYYWNVSAYDLINGTWINETYSFTTASAPAPSGGDGDVTIVIPTNTAPAKPSAPIGPNSGNVNIEYNFTASTTDSNNDQIRYKFDWGDKTISDWSELISSGSEITLSHSWNSTGSFEIKVIAKDDNNQQSGWSDSFTITISEEEISLNNESEINPPEINVEIPVNTTTENNIEFIIGDIQGYRDNNLTYHWDFGDGNTSNQKKPNHKYSIPGNYSINIKIYDSNGTLISSKSFEVTITKENNAEGNMVNKEKEENNNKFVIPIWTIFIGAIFFGIFVILILYKKQIISIQDFQPSSKKYHYKPNNKHFYKLTKSKLKNSDHSYNFDILKPNTDSPNPYLLQNDFDINKIRTHIDKNFDLREELKKV
jgi:hypothetical protein